MGGKSPHTPLNRRGRGFGVRCHSTPTPQPLLLKSGVRSGLCPQRAFLSATAYQLTGAPLPPNPRAWSGYSPVPDCAPPTISVSPPQRVCGRAAHLRAGRALVFRSVSPVGSLRVPREPLARNSGDTPLGGFAERNPLTPWDTSLSWAHTPTLVLAVLDARPSAWAPRR